MWRVVDESFLFLVLLRLVTALFLQRILVTSVVMPSSSCYAFDNSSNIYDFSSWIGHPFEYDGKNVDLVVQFCKDVETSSQTGYVNFGRFDFLNYFVPGSGPVNFIQGFYNGDLANCENWDVNCCVRFQVNIVCGSCLNGKCKGLLGCICNVTSSLVAEWRLKGFYRIVIAMKRKIYGRHYEYGSHRTCHSMRETGSASV